MRKVITIEAVIVGQTDLAWFVEVPGHHGQIPLPKKLVTVAWEIGKRDKVTMPVWLAREKGLINEKL